MGLTRIRSSMNAGTGMLSDAQDAWRKALSMNRTHDHPTISKGDAKRASIISSARHLFETQGVRKTSVSAITDEAGITRALFYYYFKNKDDVLKCVFSQYEDEAVQRGIEIVHRFDRGKAEAVDIIHMLRLCFYDDDGNELPVCKVLREVQRSSQAALNLVNKLSAILADTVVFSKRAEQVGAPVDFMAKVATVSCLGMLNLYPELSDREIGYFIYKLLGIPVDPLVD